MSDTPDKITCPTCGAECLIAGEGETHYYIPSAPDKIADLEKQLANNKSKLADLMLCHALSTGHGDTFEDLLVELEWQLAERDKEIERMRPVVNTACGLAYLSCIPRSLKDAVHRYEQSTKPYAGGTGT